MNCSRVRTAYNAVAECLYSVQGYIEHEIGVTAQQPAVDRERILVRLPAFFFIQQKGDIGMRLVAHQGVRQVRVGVTATDPHKADIRHEVNEAHGIA